MDDNVINVDSLLGDNGRKVSGCVEKGSPAEPASNATQPHEVTTSVSSTRNSLPTFTTTSLLSTFTRNSLPSNPIKNSLPLSSTKTSLPIVCTMSITKRDESEGGGNGGGGCERREGPRADKGSNRDSDKKGSVRRDERTSLKFHKLANSHFYVDHDEES